MLKLVKPCLEMKKLIAPYVEDYREDTSLFKVNMPKNLLAYWDDDDFSGYVENLRYKETSEDLPNGYVNSSTYWLMNDEEHLGMFEIRHKLTPKLIQQGGNIAYTVAPSQRGKGYAVNGVELCLREARKLGLKEVLITCDAGNEISFKVIQKAINLFGGYWLEDSFVDGHKEHRGFVKV